MRTCALAVTSSLACELKPLMASVGSFSHGSYRPGPPVNQTWVNPQKKTSTLVVQGCDFNWPGRRRPEAMHSKTRRRASPGLIWPPPLDTHFSTNNSIACRQMATQNISCNELVNGTLVLTLTHCPRGVHVGTRWHRSRITRMTMTQDWRPFALACHKQQQMQYIS